jgi:hypothetical protein
MYFCVIFTFWSPHILHRYIVVWCLYWFYSNFMILGVCDVWFAIVVHLDGKTKQKWVHVNPNMVSFMHMDDKY